MGFTSRDLKELLKFARLDVYFILAMVGHGIPTVTINQLAQDKWCVNTFAINESICLDLENAPTEFEYVRNNVLERATTLKMFTTIITTVPGIISSMFLGYWMDTYPSHIRYIFPLGPLVVVIQNLMVIYQAVFFKTGAMAILYSYIAPAITGSLVSTSTYTYATRKTPAKYRALRFMIMEVFVFASIPISSTIGGRLLGMSPWFRGQLRNYIGVLVVSAGISTLSAIWCAIYIRDTSFTEEEAKNVTGEQETKQNVTSAEKKKKSAFILFLEIFHIRNFLFTLRTAFKPRANNQRAAILITMVTLVITNVGYMGENAVGLQYSQRVYHWSSEKYSYMGATVIIIPALATLLTPTILINKFHFHDASIGVIGSISLSCGMFIRGLLLKPIAFFIASIVGAFVGLLPIATRSVISRMIRNNEIGQIYALLSSIEPLGPVISSLLYSNIFNATIDTAPGTVYLIVGALVTFPAVVMIWLYLTRHQWDLVLIDQMVSAEAAKTNEINGTTTSETENKPNESLSSLVA